MKIIFFIAVSTKKKYIAKGQDKNNNRAERNDFAVFYNQIKCNLTQSFLQI